jgi:hypothetical protein
MTKTESKVRERLLRMLVDGVPQYRRNVEDAFDKTRRQLAKNQLSLLISQGVLIQTGTGRRGHPNMVQLSPIYPISVLCPMCGQETRNLRGQVATETIK